MLAGVAVSATNSAASAVVTQIVIRMFSGNFNPAYKKAARRKMRYIQMKYMLAYQSAESGDDPRAIIGGIDPNSKLLMTTDGSRPANPFTDEPQFEDSLQQNFHPVSGHQGRFVASHAMACIGMINDYQIQRKARVWVPGVSSPGHPNDYINMFLEESKAWMRAQMTLDAVHAEELARRDNFYTKLKNDNYFWCFPPENESRSIHRVIDFLHDKVKNALELISREEKNKSLQSYFKELNDHTTNAFEFGKQYLAFLLHTNKKINGNILSDVSFDGRTYETGKLHNLLESATNIVLESYMADMSLTHERISSAARGEYKSVEGAYGSSGGNGGNSTQLAVYNGGSGSGGANVQSVRLDMAASAKNSDDLLQEAGGGQYLIEITEFEESTLKVTYTVEICDPNGLRWIIRKTYADFEALHTTVLTENRGLSEVLVLPFPAKLGVKMFRDKEELYEQSKKLQLYFVSLLFALNNCQPSTHNAVRVFMEVKELILSTNNRHLRRGEAIPNVFVSLKNDFADLLVAKEESKTGKQTQALVEFRRIWGIEMTLKVFEAYALLQRMSTVLGWTLEVNHFFISMFGNTLAFSKLPLRDIIMLQKDIMSKFLAICNELFAFACKVNADSKYKWHKNLQMVENQLNRVKFHIDKAVALIGLIDSEHLDYETQMRRLRDVHARFMPLINRIDGSLGNIQRELQLPVTQPLHVENVVYAHDSMSNNTTNNSLSGAQRPPSGALALPRGTPYTTSSSTSAELLQIAAAKDSIGSTTKPSTPEQRLSYTVEEPTYDNTAHGSHNHNAYDTANNHRDVPPSPSSGGIFSRGQSPDTMVSNFENPINSTDDNIGTSGGIAMNSGSADIKNGSGGNGYTVEELDSDDEGEGRGGVVVEGHNSTVCVIC